MIQGLVSPADDPSRLFNHHTGLGDVALACRRGVGSLRRSLNDTFHVFHHLLSLFDSLVFFEQCSLRHAEPKRDLIVRCVMLMLPQPQRDLIVVVHAIFCVSIHSDSFLVASHPRIV